MPTTWLEINLFASFLWLVWIVFLLHTIHTCIHTQTYCLRLKKSQSANVKTPLHSYTQLKIIMNERKKEWRNAPISIHRYAEEKTAKKRNVRSIVRFIYKEHKGTTFTNSLASFHSNCYKVLSFFFFFFFDLSFLYFKFTQVKTLYIKTNT